MNNNSSNLSKWDLDWLLDDDDEKWQYVLSYIKSKWPVEFASKVPFAGAINEGFIRDLFIQLLDQRPYDARVIIRKTKEAWRSHKQNLSRRNSGNYTYIKLTKADKDMMNRLASEAGLSSICDVVSSILNGQYRELIADKKAERKMLAKNKADDKDKTLISGMASRFFSGTLNEDNRILKERLKESQQKLATMIDLFSKQLVTLERYENEGIAPLTDEELARARELNQDMLESLEEGIS